MDEEEREIEQKMIKVIQKMPNNVQDRFKMLHMLSDQRSKINDEFEKEVKALEAKYAAKKQPLFETRKQIIAGELTDFSEYVPKFEETHNKLESIVSGIVKSEEEAAADKAEEESKEPINVDHLKEVQGIPDFWEKSIRNNKMIMHCIREADEKLLPSIKSIEAVRFEKPKALELKIQFKENEYFENDELSLKLIYKSDTEEIESTEGSSINWKEGKDLTKKKIKKKQKNKKTGETRTITKTVEAESFFNAFTSMKAPEQPDEEDSDENSELERALDRFDEACQIAEDFYDLFAQDALEYYLGLMEDDDFMGLGMGDSDEDDDDDDEDGDEKKKKKSKKGPPVGPDGKECKQQ